MIGSLSVHWRRSALSTQAPWLRVIEELSSRVVEWVEVEDSDSVPFPKKVQVQIGLSKRRGGYSAGRL